MARFIGVGVGPGDPELLTDRARRVLREADRVMAPTLAVDAIGRAESIVRQGVPGLPVERLVFSMSGDGPARHAALATAAERVVACLDAGEDVAFVTLGDPNIYSTFPAVAALVTRERPTVPVQTVPGVMAFQALAAEAGTVLLDGRESMVLVTALDGPESLDPALADPERAVVVYKGGRHLPAIAERLRSAGRLDGAVVGELLGLPGQRVGPAAALATEPATYLATVIVPPAGRASERLS